MVNWIRIVSFDEVVGYWLNYEYNSRLDVKACLDLSYKDVIPYIGENDYADLLGNEQRRRGLHAIRGGILQLLPLKIEWWDARIEDSDTSRLNLINSSDWRSLTDGTLKPYRAAQRISSEQELRRGEHKNQVNFILKNYVNWEANPSRLVIVGPRAGPCTVIDGVHRTVGFFLYHYLEKHGALNPRDAYLGVTDAPWNPQFL